MTLRKGFTLIELLVVIAIIGILASVVLASLNSARSGGQDAAVQSQLSSARTQAELYYTDNGNSYEGACADADGLLTLVNAAIEAGGGTPPTYADGSAATFSTGQCHDAASTWVATAALTGSLTGAGNARMWCVDSTGTSSLTTDVLAADATACTVTDPA